MTWRHYLQVKTRRPAFLWRMVIAIIAAGMLGAIVFEGQLRSRPQTDEGRGQFNRSVERLDNLADSGEWAALWWALPKVVFHRISYAPPVLLAAFAGCWWFAFCLHAAQIRGRRDPQLWLLPLAVLLGGLSVWPTHFLSIWIEHRWNVHESAELAEGLRFYILGVGVPEEVAKLLCFLPLTPILLRLRSDLTALIAAGFVGLGFAIVENMGYFAASQGADAVGRFLTANPMHITLTGVAGLALYRALRDPKGWVSHAVAMIGLMIFAHGLYDAAIVIPELADIGILSTIIFALVVYQFFRELRELRSPRVETISLTATFLAGVSMVIAATLVYISSLSNFGQAADVMVMNVLSLAVMAYLFLREMPDTMVTV